MSHHLESPIARQDWYVFRDSTQVTIVGHSTGGGEVVRYIARHGQNPRRPWLVYHIYGRGQSGVAGNPEGVTEHSTSVAGEALTVGSNQ